MVLDKFGRSLDAASRTPTQPPLRLPFSYTSEGNLQFENVQLSNVKTPFKPKDVANKSYVDDNITKIEGEIKTITKTMIDFKMGLQHVSYETDTLTQKQKHLEEEGFEMNKKTNNDWSTALNTHKKENENRLNEMNKKTDDWIKTTSDILSDLKTVQEQLHEKLTGVDSLVKNVERELNQFRFTVVPQISELSLMIKNGDDSLKREMMKELQDQIKKGADSLKRDMSKELRRIRLTSP